MARSHPPGTLNVQSHRAGRRQVDTETPEGRAADRLGVAHPVRGTLIAVVLAPVVVLGGVLVVVAALFVQHIVGMAPAGGVSAIRWGYHGSGR